jgi:hypothetical protein
MHILPAGPYVLFAKMTLVTRVDDETDGHDSSRAEISLEAGGLVDNAFCALWHSKDQGAFPPSDTISLQLATTVKGPTPKSNVAAAEVKVFFRAVDGIIEIRDLVITAISVDTIEEQDSPF